MECSFEIYENHILIEKLEGISCFFNLLYNNVLNLENFNDENKDNLNFSQRFTILNDVYEYDKIRSLENFKNILKTIKDVSYLNIYDKNEMTYFKSTDFFRKYFLGNRERLKAYGNGFNGIKKLNELNEIYVEIKNGVKVCFRMELGQKDSLFPNSIYSVVGKNGLGKSLILREIYLNYTDSFNGVKIFSSELISQSYFRRIARNDDSYINVSKNSNLNYLISEILIFKDTDSSKDISSMLFFLLANIFSDKRYENVFISGFVNYRKIKLQDFFEKLGKGSFLNEIKGKVILSRFIGEKQYSLSSGEKVILNVILNMSLDILKSGGEKLFIFDEPENHLHPNFISQLMNFINKILYYSNSYAVIATHSPFVVKNLLKENIFVLKHKNEKVISEKISFNTLGANVETISQFVFGNNDLMELEREIVNDLVGNYPRDWNFDKGEILEKLSCDLSPELILEILEELKGKYEIH